MQLLISNKASLHKCTEEVSLWLSEDLQFSEYKMERMWAVYEFLWVFFQLAADLHVYVIYFKQYISLHHVIRGR